MDTHDPAAYDRALRHWLRTDRGAEKSALERDILPTSAVRLPDDWRPVPLDHIFYALPALRKRGIVSVALAPDLLPLLIRALGGEGFDRSCLIAFGCQVRIGERFVEEAAADAVHAWVLGRGVAAGEARSLALAQIARQKIQALGIVAVVTAERGPAVAFCHNP